MHTVDVSNQKAAVATFENIGALNILVNDAGIVHIGKADSIDGRFTILNN